MKKVCLDYGHGGYDPGGVYKGNYESRDNLLLGSILAAKLRRRGLDLVETRTSDEYVSLEARTRLSNEKDVDYFISIHRNAFMPEVAKGVEVYIYKNASKKARDLAERVEKSLVKLGFKSRGVKLSNFYVLKNTRAPAILIEVGFIDNTGDNNIFHEKLCEIAKNISQEIVDTL